MSLSTCGRCWDNPCSCGHRYLFSNAETLRARAALLQDIADFIEAHPTAQDFASASFTERDERFEQFRKWRANRKTQT